MRHAAEGLFTKIFSDYGLVENMAKIIYKQIVLNDIISNILFSTI